MTVSQSNDETEWYKPAPYDVVRGVLTDAEIDYQEYGSGTCRITLEDASVLTTLILDALRIESISPADPRNPYKFHDAARYSAGYSAAIGDILGERFWS